MKEILTGIQLKPPELPDIAEKAPVCLSEPKFAKKRREKIRRAKLPAAELTVSVLGIVAGIVILLYSKNADFSGSLLCFEGNFPELLIKRLLWGLCFLLAEYVCGYFALGWLIVWAAPLVAGLGTGCALAAAFKSGGNAVPLIFTSLGTIFAIAKGAAASKAMSLRLLDLMSNGKCVVSSSAAAGAYTLDFLVWFGVMSFFSLAESAVRVLS